MPAVRVCLFAVFVSSLAGAIVARQDSTDRTRRAEEALLPEGRGQAIVVERCTQCHGLEIVREQRLGTAAWGREVDKMIVWGSTVTPGERDDIVSYLAVYFGPEAALSVAALDEGEGAALLSRCVLCHDTRPIESQRLTVQGWTREIDKMIGWGAIVSESERQRLSKYLAIRFGPTP